MPTFKHAFIVFAVYYLSAYAGCFISAQLLIRGIVQVAHYFTLFRYFDLPGPDLYITFDHVGNRHFSSTDIEIAFHFSLQADFSGPDEGITYCLTVRSPVNFLGAQKTGACHQAVNVDGSGPRLYSVVYCPRYIDGFPTSKQSQGQVAGKINLLTNKKQVPGLPFKLKVLTLKQVVLSKFASFY